MPSFVGSRRLGLAVVLTAGTFNPAWAASPVDGGESPISKTVVVKSTKAEAIFGASGLGQLERSPYFLIESYSRPIDLEERGMGGLDMTGSLRSSLANGTLWERSGDIPRLSMPKLANDEPEATERADSFRPLIAVGAGPIIVLGVLGLLSFVWECSGTRRLPVRAGE